jgi:hypothetical protein
VATPRTAQSAWSSVLAAARWVASGGRHSGGRRGSALWEVAIGDSGPGRRSRSPSSWGPGPALNDRCASRSRPLAPVAAECAPLWCAGRSRPGRLYGTNPAATPHTKSHGRPRPPRSPWSTREDRFSLPTCPWAGVESPAPTGPRGRPTLRLVGELERPALLRLLVALLARPVGNAADGHVLAAPTPRRVARVHDLSRRPSWRSCS